MKPFEDMTVAQIKALTPEEIEAYAEDAGKRLLAEPTIFKAQCIKVGRQAIKNLIGKLSL